MAFHEAERDGVAAGLALLDAADAVPGLPPRVRGLAASQRGLLHMRAGAVGPALTDLDAALRLLDEPGDVCRALLNRGILRLRSAAPGRARADFARCADLAARHGLDLLAAKAGHNLGYLSMLAGDLPRALREMDAVAPELARRSPAAEAVHHADRARVLLAAGLYGEADEDLRRAVGLFRVARVPQEAAEAELGRAEVALGRERWADARRLARAAGRRFAARGAGPWALLADAVAVAADVRAGRRLAAAGRDAVRLVARLAAVGLVDEARRAALTAGAAVLGRRGTGRRDAGYADRAVAARAVAGAALRLRPDDPLGTRLEARELRVALADADGLPRRAATELRAAVAELHRHQSQLGSPDLRAATAGQGRRLAAEGLARAVSGGRPALVFAWAERARALSARLPPVVPPDDPETAGLLAELRHARADLRAQVLARAVDPALRARCGELERRLRQRSWRLAGPRRTTAPAALGAVQDALAEPGGTLVAHLLCGDGLYALVATGRRRALHHLGPAGPAVELHRRLRADLDALALGPPEPVRRTVRAAARSALCRLDALLWAPVRRRLADGPLLLAPSAALAPVPWPLLPGLRGRPVAVVASATAWLASRRPAVADPVVAVAAGPRVPRAEAEARLVAAGWPGATVLTGPAATAAAVARAAGRADLLHVAAHGVHEPDNPLFSHLELVDGPLFGYDLDRLARPPAHVVLSACELGLARAAACDETLGLTAALLRGGAGSVVAGVARVGDAAAHRVGPAHHAGLRRGLTPAAALAAALATGSVDWADSDDGHDPAPLVCFGAGW